MSRVIWKFELRPGEPVMMPPGATILHVGVLAHTPCVWALVTPCNLDQFVARQLYVVCTGQEPDAGRYVGTFILEAENFVGHVYDADWPA